MKKVYATTLFTFLASLLGLTLMTQSTFALEPEAKLTGNMSLVGDYRFRGFTQTNYGPAIQGGLDWEHRSGLYLGNWNSSVAQNLYNGASLEMDFYGGFKSQVPGLLGFPTWLGLLCFAGWSVPLLLTYLATGLVGGVATWLLSCVLAGILG